MRHDINDPIEVLRIAQTADYIDQNSNVTVTGKLLFEFGMYDGVHKNNQHQFT
jgi:hypothetical protein